MKQARRESNLSVLNDLENAEEKLKQTKKDLHAFKVEKDTKKPQLDQVQSEQAELRLEVAFHQAELRSLQQEHSSLPEEIDQVKQLVEEINRIEIEVVLLQRAKQKAEDNRNILPKHLRSREAPSLSKMAQHLSVSSTRG